MQQVYDPDRIKHGMVVRDAISGVEGTVVAITSWLFGCVRITVQPDEVKDGKPAETFTFDEPSAVVVHAETQFTQAMPPSPPVPEPTRPHGDRATPGRSPDPGR